MILYLPATASAITIIYILFPVGSLKITLAFPGTVVDFFTSVWLGADEFRYHIRGMTVGKLTDAIHSDCDADESCLIVDAGE